MRHNHIGSLVYLAIIFILLNQGASALEGDSYPKSVVDSANRSVLIPLPIERIIVLNSDAAEAVVTLGAGDKIVGITEAILQRSGHLPGLVNKQVIGSSQMGGEADYELIAEIAAQGNNSSNLLVIGFSGVGKDYGARAVEERLAPFGIVNVGLDFYQPENLSREMTVLGKILEKEDQARSYLDWREEKIQIIEDAVSDLSPPTVYVERSPKKGLGDLISYGNGSGMDDLVRMARGMNIAGELEKSAHVEWEWVLTEDPEVIVRTMSSEGALGWENDSHPDIRLLEETIDEILSRPGGQNLTAARNQRVYVAYSDLFYGMESVAGLAYLARILHPEADLDPEGIFSEYLERLGLEVPADRVFVYGMSDYAYSQEMIG